MKSFASRLALPFAALLALLLLLPSSATAQIGPDDLLVELDKAIKGQAVNTTLWKNHLDTDFSNWRLGGSQNLPVVAAAIALWEDPYGVDQHGVSYNIFDWWQSFLLCQNGTGCNVSSPGSLYYMKGSEVLSNTYDAAVTTAVAAVNYYQHTIASDSRLSEARLYLRKTWSLYGLAAGSGPARTVIDDRDDPSGPVTVSCQVNTSNQFWYTGPFLPLAGARSTNAHYCQDDRGPLFARAIDFFMSANNRESPGQEAVLNYIEPNFGGFGAEDVFALDSSSRQLLRDHLNFGNAASTLVSVINNGNTRFIRTMRFLAWSGVRVSVMEGNPNRNTAAVYGAKYTASTEQAHMLYPWESTAARKGITEGYGQLLPTVSSPSSVEASNLAANESPNGFHGTRVVSMSVPASTPQYHVVVGRTFAAYFQ